MTVKKSFQSLVFVGIIGTLALPSASFAGDCSSLYQAKIDQIQQKTENTVGDLTLYCMGFGGTTGAMIGFIAKGGFANGAGGSPAPSAGPGYIIGALAGAGIMGTGCYFYEKYFDKKNQQPVNQQELQDYLVPLKAIQEAEASDPAQKPGDIAKNFITHQIEQKLAAEQSSLGKITDQQVWDAVLSLNSQSGFCNNNLDDQNQFLSLVKSKLAE
jgi:hypothetical protein